MTKIKQEDGWSSSYGPAIMADTMVRPLTGAKDVVESARIGRSCVREGRLSDNQIENLMENLTESQINIREKSPYSV